MTDQIKRSVIVDGEKTDGTLFETGNKVYLIEKGVYRSEEYTEARMLYEKDGQLRRTKQAVRIYTADIFDFISDFIVASGLALFVISEDEIMQAEQAES